MNKKARELALTRVFDAPRDLVWKAWSDPKHMAIEGMDAGWTQSLERLGTLLAKA
jgi:hypothetical protein